MEKGAVVLETIYENTVDRGEFSVVVTSDSGDPYRGRIVVTVTNTDEVLLDEEVTITYAAAFGPDIDDVGLWQEMALEVIDAYLEELEA